MVVWQSGHVLFIYKAWIYEFADCAMHNVLYDRETCKVTLIDFKVISECRFPGPIWNQQHHWRLGQRRCGFE